MLASARTVVFGLVLAASLVLGVGSAQAANLVANPGFEMQCPPSGLPCNWTAGSGSTIARLLVPHMGFASLGVNGTGATMTPSARSDCFLVSPSATYNVGVWYRTNNAAVVGVRARTFEFFDNTCTPGQGVAIGGATTSSPVTNDQWRHLAAPRTTDALAHSAFLQLDFSCFAACASSLTVLFDDAAVQTEPLAATVTSFAARPLARGVLLRWRTGAEAETLGFHVYRQGTGKRVKATRGLIPARGSLSGATYSYVDRRAPRAARLRYWLQVVDVDGSRTWRGPIRVRTKSAT
jgi:hypothetical protein